jgi:REP element-mobilizing transposase RayT
MPQSFQSVYIHFVWSTKNRVQFISEDVEVELYKYMASIFRHHKSPSLIINGYKDHVHVLASLSRVITIAKLMEEVKRESSKWVKSKGDFFKYFYWQTGYAAIGIGKNQIVYLKKYIKNQKSHHRQKSFKEEYVELLKKDGVDYDERFMWD